MSVSGKRAGVEFEQVVQSPLVTIVDSNLPGIFVGAFYQIIESISSGIANPDAIALDANGDPVLYEGAPLSIAFFSDTVNLTGAVALPKLLDKSMILPNERGTNAVATDTFFKVFLNTPGTDEFFELTLGNGVSLDVNVTGETVGISITGAGLGGYSATKKANVIVGLRALRRDYSRRVLKTDANTFATLAGGTQFGPENPVAFALQNYFEAAPTNFGYAVAVDEVSDGEPDGTYYAFQRAFELAATADIYSVVPLSRDPAVVNLTYQHVIDQSQPENRHERTGYVSTVLPENEANDVIVSGVGELQLVRAMFRHFDATPAAPADQYDVAVEALQGGTAVNSTIAFSVINSTAGGLTVTADNRLNSTVTDWDSLAGSATVAQQISGVPGTAITAPAAGDLFRYTLSAATPVSPTPTGLLTATRFIDNNINFNAAGAKAGDVLTITSGVNADTFEVQGVTTTTVTPGSTTPFNTLIVVQTGVVVLVPASGTVTYELELELLVLTGGVASVTLDHIIPVTIVDTFAFTLHDATIRDIIVDHGVATPVADSATVVAALNASTDARALANFYVGPQAYPGAGSFVPLVAATLLTGGLDTFTQFYTNGDVSLVTLLPLTYLDMETESKDFEVTSVRLFNGSVIVSDPLAVDLTGIKITESFALYNLGAALVTVTPLGNEPDKEGQSDILATFPTRFASRRIVAIWPDTATRTVNGVQVEVPGYYLAATLAGMTASLPSEQGHSELPIPSWTSLQHSNDYCKESQLEKLTAAGMWVYVQDVSGGPIVSRKQYTTDVSGDVTAERSITVIVDDFAKVVRNSVKPLLGRNNITPEIVDRVRLIINSTIARFVSRKAIAGATLNSLEPSTEPGDITTLIGDVTFTFFGPFNLLRIRLNL